MMAHFTKQNVAKGCVCRVRAIVVLSEQWVSASPLYVGLKTHVLMLLVFVLGLHVNDDPMPGEGSSVGCSTSVAGKSA